MGFGSLLMDTSSELIHSLLPIFLVTGLGASMVTVGTIEGIAEATAAILKFLAMYNQYLWPLMVTQDEGFRPVMVGLQYFFQLNTPWGELMAYLSVITVPVLAFYLVLQRAFISSIASTGVKG